MKTLKIVAFLLAAAAALLPSIRSSAHATCFDSFTCCSPHGQNASTTGCTFYDCTYGALQWLRSYRCTAGSQGATGCGCASNQIACGDATAYQDHTVSNNCYACGSVPCLGH